MPRKPHVRLAIMAKCAPEILQRAVDSVRPFIDSACVLINKRDFGVLPTEGFGYMSLETKVVQREWAGHAASRTELLRQAEVDHWVDWVLVLDADDVVSQASRMPDLEASGGVDAFALAYDLCGQGFHLRASASGGLVRARRGFSWEGPDRHESLVASDEARSFVRHDGFVIHRAIRANEARWLEDADLFAIAAPTDPRRAFQYAWALRGAGRLDEAIGAFQRRVAMENGDLEETFWAQLMVGVLGARLGLNPINPLIKAQVLAPARAEPLWHMASWYRDGAPEELRDLRVIESLTKQANACPYPRDARLVELAAYHPDALREADSAP